MKILLHSLLLLSGISLIAARSIWGNHYPSYDEGLFGYPYPRDYHYKHGRGDIRSFSKFLDEVLEEDSSYVPLITKTSDEHDDVYNNRDIDSLISERMNELDSTLDKLMDDYGDERKTADESQEITNEKDEDDNDNTNEDKEEEEEKDEINDKSNEEIYDEPKVSLVLSKSSEESNETLTPNSDSNTEDDNSKQVMSVSIPKSSEEKLDEQDEEINEKEIRELAAFLVTLSTIEDLLKVAEATSDEDKSQNAEELYEQKLKEVDDFMGLFGNVLDAMLEESSAEIEKDSVNTESDKDNGKEIDTDGDDDKDDEDDSKDDNDDDDDKKEKNASDDDTNNNEGVSIFHEFHSIDDESNTQYMDNHKYNVFERSATVHDFQPTSSPFTPEPSSTLPDNYNDVIINEYVEERENLDALQENLLSNKLNMDKDFYHIIANEGDEKNIEKFANNIAAMRENIFKIKQSLNAMQNIKSKLYFHQLIKSALKTAQIN